MTLLSMLRGNIVGAIISAILTIALNVYILWSVWSFYVRLEAGDINTLKFGPHYDPATVGNVVQGQVVQGQAVTTQQGGQVQGGTAPIYNANVNNQGTTPGGYQGGTAGGYQAGYQGGTAGGYQGGQDGGEQEMTKPGDRA
eukprot:CAMPEP_0115013344 /NCGR_PEP_ID=MMETSP0216-20121206/25345_1 /TAXON_ID=223996 /ORGANISM="Protocruzia adherens, Strain Boccale" /LENGTH=140 /DNA_ID=CAMNT_0002382711 /DNA_START=460 /DNA_END=882 /DNA_ORIENTATION=+